MRETREKYIMRCILRGSRGLEIFYIFIYLFLFIYFLFSEREEIVNSCTKQEETKKKKKKRVEDKQYSTRNYLYQ